MADVRRMNVAIASRLEGMPSYSYNTVEGLVTWVRVDLSQTPWRSFCTALLCCYPSSSGGGGRRRRGRGKGSDGRGKGRRRAQKAGAARSQTVRSLTNLPCFDGGWSTPQKHREICWTGPTAKKNCAHPTQVVVSVRRASSLVICKVKVAPFTASIDCIFFFCLTNQPWDGTPLLLLCGFGLDTC